MPTINQLPVAKQINPADEIPISQGGATRNASISSLLAATQPVIIAATNTLLGRVSLGPGGPEPVGLGPGLALTSGSLAATGADHASFPVLPSLNPADEAVINSAGLPHRMPLSQLRSLFTPGANVTIDPNGVISSGAAGSPGATGAPGATGPAGPAGSAISITAAPATVSIAATDLVGVSQAGKDHAISLANLLTASDVSKTMIVPSGATAASTIADYAARVVNPKDFGAKGDGLADDYPAFAAAIGSANGGPVILRITRPATAYALSKAVSGFNASVVIDDGVVFAGASGGSPFYVGRTEQRSNGQLKVVSQGSQAGIAIAHETDVVNNGPHAAYGETFSYQAFLSAADAGAGDIARAESAHWHAGPGPGMMGHWFVTCSPDPSEASDAVYGMSAAEVNVVFSGAPTGWKPSPAGLNQWACGFNFVPDAGYQFFGNGSHVLYGWGVHQNGGANKAGIVPKTYNGFLVGADAIAPGGRALYVTGDTTNLAANFPHAPFEAGTGNWATGIRTDTATIASGTAVQMAANQAITWVDASEAVIAGLYSGTGVPALAAPAGSIYARRDGGAGATLYIKETGAAAQGWASYGVGPAWTPPKRIVSIATDTPTTADDGGLIACTSASAVTMIVGDLGANRSFSVMQQGAGQVTIAAAASTTLVSDKATPSFVTARRGAIMSVLCDGNGTAYVVGNTR